MLMFLEENSGGFFSSLSVLDFILAGIVLVGMFIGAKKGFIDQIFGILGTFGALLGAILLCKTVGGMLSTDGFIFDKISEFIEGKFTGVSESVYTTVADWTNPDNVSAALGILNLSILTKLLTSVFATFGEAALCDVLPLKITELANIAIAFIALFIVLTIVIFILKKVFGSVGKLPVISTVNRILGFVLGGVFAALLIVAACFLLVTLGGFIPALGNFVTNEIYPTVVGGFLQKLVDIISGFISNGI